MNHSKIARYYKAVGYANLAWLKAAADYQPEYNTIEYRVESLLADEATGGADYRTDWRQGITFKNMDDDTIRLDKRGERQYEHLEARTLPMRVYQWAVGQLHEPEAYGGVYAALKEAHPGHDVWTAHAMQYPPADSTEKAIGVLAFGIEDDFAVVLRGLRAYQRKQAKATKKIMAQLAVYHATELQRQELDKLRQGHWLGADKALTTAPRVNDPNVPFLGDMALTPEQRSRLHYWAVPEGKHMSAAFPAGTGIALKEVTSGKELIDGAVYLSQTTWGKPGDAHYGHTMILGRLDMSKKSYGSVPLRWDDEPERPLNVKAEWKKKEDADYEVKLLQVVAYTTRAEQVAPVMVAETQPMRPAMRSSKKRALQAAA
ncbi:hypothetical protein [Hymenobacter negativus]|uniref:Uncharacterized protein n=1 Tax=Hymenobacter negativus TaxID=2795026 RepID=A0ABS3QEP9_9BACT|nr:hypothetical protein [Hymenobacter negativus]MBO2009205.1 hypothetical protein [Hymenobacter negativus]